MSEETKKNEPIAEEPQPPSELSEEQLKDASGGIIIYDRTKTSSVRTSLTNNSYGGPDARQQFITDEEH